MNILITGGTGYIGANVAASLIAAGHNVVLLDDLSNSDGSAALDLRRLTGATVPFYIGDAQHESYVASLMRSHQIEHVVHLAAFKSVGESVDNPLGYYGNNLVSLLSVVRAAQMSSVRSLSFASSAAVYGPTRRVIEDTPTDPATPYGWSKVMGERILWDLAQASPQMTVVVFRYFNPVGAHEAGLFGDRSTDRAGLWPAALDVALGKRDALDVYGDDWPTPDRTARRDYVHVSDIADAHVMALHARPGFHIYNLGTGRPTSVLEVAGALQEASGRALTLNYLPRRRGDVSESWCNPQRARHGIGWVARRSLADAARDAWRAEIYSNPS